VATLLFIASVLWPPHGTYVLDDAATFTFGQHLAKSLADIGLAFSNSIPASFAIAGLLYVWCARRGVRLILAIPLVGNSLIFGFLRGGYHHTGILVIGAVTALWAGWPAAVSAAEFKWYRLSVIALSLLFAYQCTWSWTAIRTDWYQPYSGAGDTAEFLKASGAASQGVEGYGYFEVAVQPYFDSNIFENLRQPGGGAFFHSSVEYQRKAALSRSTVLKSTWVVVSSADPDTLSADQKLLEKAGYRLMHVSPGQVVFHIPSRGEPQTYLIFRRVRP